MKLESEKLSLKQVNEKFKKAIENLEVRGFKQEAKEAQRMLTTYQTGPSIIDRYVTETKNNKNYEPILNFKQNTRYIKDEMCQLIETLYNEKPPTADDLKYKQRMTGLRFDAMYSHSILPGASDYLFEVASSLKGSRAAATHLGVLDELKMTLSNQPKAKKTPKKYTAAKYAAVISELKKKNIEKPYEQLIQTQQHQLQGLKDQILDHKAKNRLDELSEHTDNQNPIPKNLRDIASKLTSSLSELISGNTAPSPQTPEVRKQESFTEKVEKQGKQHGNDSRSR